jgi:uncharacterized membrane protein
VLLSGAIIVIALLGAGLHAPIDRQLRAWKLLPEPERLTELYFSHPNDLPANYVPGQSQTVAFTVHNLEYRPTAYRYQIVEQSQDSSASQTLAQGSFSLAQGQYQSPSVNISTPDLGPNVKVEVELMNVNESIDYLLARSGA